MNGFDRFGIVPLLFLGVGLFTAISIVGYRRFLDGASRAEGEVVSLVERSRATATARTTAAT